MPIYEFLCPACGHHFEKLVKLNETPACPSCACPEPERQLSLSAGISTGKTRGKARNEAVQINKVRQSEQKMAHAEYLKKHNEDHH